MRVQADLKGECEQAVPNVKKVVVEKHRQLGNVPPGTASPLQGDTTQTGMRDKHSGGKVVRERPDPGISQAPWHHLPRLKAGTTAAGWRSEEPQTTC